MNYHITAIHKRTKIKVDMFYPSIYEAKKENPSYEEFKICGK